MKKEEAIRILATCAEQYSSNLASKNLLYAFDDGGKNLHLESLFLPRHYLHLTGVRLLSNSMRSVDFYSLCLRNQLSPTSFSFHENGTTELKLSVLPQIMSLHRTAKMVGDYDNTKSVLITEKIVGTVTACVGFVRDGSFYVPNTVLREDIRAVTVSPQKRILAIFVKETQEAKYPKCSYLAKGVTMESVLSSPEIQAKVALA